MTASGTTDGDAYLFGALDSGSDCAPTREEEYGRATYVISPGAAQVAITGAGPF